MKRIYEKKFKLPSFVVIKSGNTLIFGYFFDPMNTICSTKCANPGKAEGEL